MSKLPLPIRLAALACLGAAGLVSVSCGGVGSQRADDPLPAPPREFRGAWVATVANIDWPSEPGLPVDEQRREALAILDRLAELNMNAVVFQVRPQADALYASPLEPWSYYLTGAQGRAPEPAYDPLEFWVEEAHARGLQLHAWLNPYRANHPAHRGELHETSVVRARPELCVQLGDQGYWWMDPAIPAVQDHCVAVVLDVVSRYDVDGVHFDDYFYPYPSYHGDRDFPDDRSWEAYRAAGGELERGDWRRQAVDRLIERLYAEIKATKPWVAFGISPFGIWRPGHPPGIHGLDQYAVLYADAKRWFEEGWVDYLTPQLYWPIAQVPQSFPVLLGWWQAQNAHGRHLWPGTTIGRAREEAGATEVVNQIMIARGMTPGEAGICMFSMKSLQSSRSELPERLLDGPYARPALVPAAPWLDAEPPQAPEVSSRLAGDRLELSWSPRGVEAAAHWVVYAERNGRWTHTILPARERTLALDPDVTRFAVTAVDRCGNESARAPRPAGAAAQ